jgi:hypothetical protein
MSGELFVQIVGLIILFVFINTFVKCMHNKYCKMCKK